MKTKIFLAPVSSSDVFYSYHKSVMNGIQKKEFQGLRNTNQYKEVLTQIDPIRIWGLRNNRLDRFKKIAFGDYILFYHKGFIIGKANVLFKDKNKELSIDLWGYNFVISKNQIQYWENLIFLKDYKHISINYKVLIDYAAYSSKACVRGFQEYSELGLTGIINDFDQIENFIRENNSLRTGRTPKS